MTTSPYVARSPRVSAQRPWLSTATNTLRTIKGCFRGRVTALPVSGASKSAKFRKLDPLDGCLVMNVHELAEIVRVLRPADAVMVLRSLAEDGSKGFDVCVKLAAIPRWGSRTEAIAELATSFGAFVCAVKSDDRRRISDLEIGLEARARAVMLAEGA